MNPAEQTYIGDGVYASFDGYQILLSTKRGYDTHYIYLEPAVFTNLLRYADSLKTAGFEQSHRKDKP